MGAVTRAMTGFILPHQCVICRKFCETTGLCASCWRGLALIAAPFCTHCGRPLPYSMPDLKCGACWLAPPPLAKIRAASLYGDVSRTLILRLKHGNGLQLVPLLGRLLHRSFTKICNSDHLVVPIPLHRYRYWRRRYNQSAELARYLCKHNNSGVFAPDILHRIRPTRTQGGLNREQRAKNIKDSFQVPTARRGAIAGRPVLLIDDVITTGATIYEAAKCLKQAGSGPVSAAVIARVS